MRLVLLLSAALSFAFGGLFMKQADGLTKLLPSLGVFALFSVGAACQTLAMKRSDMSSIYVLVLGFEAIAAFALAAILLGERLTVEKMTALVLIAGGILILER